MAPKHARVDTSNNLEAASLPSPFARLATSVRDNQAARNGYLRFSRKDPLHTRLMRSAIDRDHGIELDPTDPLQRVITDLIDTPAIQRLKLISQLSTASWVYPDAVHSRFVHVVGSACLTADVLRRIHAHATPDIKVQIDRWGPVVVAFAMTHDLGHIAPGSHIAQRVWFPRAKDSHEKMSHTILRKDAGIRTVLRSSLGDDGADMLDRVVEQDPSVPRWTWQLITAGGWNTDRGDWVRRDGNFCGVSYGSYDLPIIKKTLTISRDHEIVIKEAGVPTLEAFFTARANLYRNVYRHPTCRIGEHMHVMVGQRARELYASNTLPFADETMRRVLATKDGGALDANVILNMTEAWWQYHITQWSSAEDTTLRELSSRVLLRQPFKHFPMTDDNRRLLKKMVRTSGLDQRYFYVEMNNLDVKLRDDLREAIKVQRGDGSVVPLTEHSSFMQALDLLDALSTDSFIAVPQDIFKEFK